MNEICSIIINSDQYPPNFRHIIEDSQYIIAADGSWDDCLRLGIDADIVIGDMDSVSRPDNIAEAKKMHIFDQDRSDTEKAIDYAVSLGYQQINLIGICGNRFDHSLYHLHLMHRYKKECTLIGYSQTERCWIITGSQTIEGKPGQRISLIKSGDEPLQLRTKGLRWPVTAIDRPSISNSFVGDKVLIECLTQGSAVLVMLEYYGV